MIDHVSLGTRRYAEAVAFYSRVLAPLGLQLLRDTGGEAAFGTPQRWCFFLYPVPELSRAQVSPEISAGYAFLARSGQIVRYFNDE